MAPHALRSVKGYCSSMLEADGRDPALTPALLALFGGMRVLTRCQTGWERLAAVVDQIEVLLPN